MEGDQPPKTPLPQNGTVVELKAGCRLKVKKYVGEDFTWRT